MAYVTFLKDGEGLQVGESVFILKADRGAKVVLEVDDSIVIKKLSREHLQNERWRKKAFLPDRNRLSTEVD